MIVPPPNGYETWLDYAAATMDTRTEYHERIWDGRNHSREDIRESAIAELAALRAGRVMPCQQYQRGVECWINGVRMHCADVPCQLS